MSDQNSPRAFSRRQFLKTASITALSAPALLSAHAANGRPKIISPNQKLNHACIGNGGMGWADLQNILQHKRTQIVALCDVDALSLDRAAKAVPGARLYSDWRELLEQEGDKIDSVNVAVPDHMHFAISYSAIHKGKHVYCQKPLCHDVAEVRALTELAMKNGVISQLGTQAASDFGDRTAVRWLKEGRIGKIKHAYICSNRPGAVRDYRLEGPRPEKGEPPPKHLNWDLWLGTAPERPFAAGIYHPAKWRAWQDFGTGWSGDIGCHLFDAVWKGLGLKAPNTVYAEVQPSWKNSAARHADVWPQGDHITWAFPQNDLIEGKELVIEWFDGEYFPPDEIRKLYSEDLKDYPTESAMLIGTEGALLNTHSFPPELLPESKFKDVKRPDLPPRNHYHHFLDACLGGEKTESHFAQTGPMTEAVLLGTVALRVPNQTLHWNQSQMKFTNSAEANNYLKRQYRDGWHVAKF